jgi:hypothetical protein
MSEKAKTIFDHISGVTDKKVNWDKLSKLDQNSFSPYLINRWLSMNMEFVEIVNELQKYTIGQVSARETYKLYFDILPKQKQFNKYIKGKKSEKYNSNLIELIAAHLQTSEKEAVEYLELCDDLRLNTVKEILKNYGKTDKEISALFKSK